MTLFEWAALTAAIVFLLAGALAAARWLDKTENGD